MRSLLCSLPCLECTAGHRLFTNVLCGCAAQFHEIAKRKDDYKIMVIEGEGHAR